MSFNIFNIFKFFKRSKKQPTQPKKFTLVYSAEADALFGHNKVMTVNNEEVRYTLMMDEAIHGPWRDFYKFKDAVVVGYVSDYHITYYGIKPHPYEEY